MELLTLSGTLILLLLGGNAFFVRGLIGEIKKANATSSAGALIIENLARQIEEMKNEIKDLRKLEIEVAVLKSHLSHPPRRAESFNPSDT